MTNKLPYLLALLSAAFFGLSTPASKLLLDSLSPFQLAGMLYLGAAIGVTPWLIKTRVLLFPWQLNRRNRLYLLGAIANGGILAINLLLGMMVSPLAASPTVIAWSLTVGIFAYGFSIVLCITSAQNLGATRSQLIFACAPFFGVIFSAIALQEQISSIQLWAIALKLISILALFQDQHGHHHRHQATNHQHLHRHNDKHHNHHRAQDLIARIHSHWHEHQALVHTHQHLPDLHHRHNHD